MSYYYEDLSGDNRSDDDDSSSSDSDHDDDEFLFRNNDTASHRIILQCDVDCFYCQCEMLERQLPPDRPLAVGQKHIIVTCNYAARRAGIRKLQSRAMAQQALPDLLIVDGSDLELYKSRARTIYTSFRRACQKLVVVPNAGSVAVCKGSMDEMMADLTHMMASIKPCDDDDKSIYIHGEDTDTTTLTEDQSGATAVVVTQPRHRQTHSTCDNERLYQAAQYAQRVRETILHETGFTTTMGVSVNPLLAKIAGGLRKPHTVNLLLQNRAPQLLEAMPLRKIPGVGHRTSKVLEPCLQAAWRRRAHPDAPIPAFWTCGYV